jgi:hypothetical protein
MQDWLAKLAEEPKSEEQILHETIESLPADLLTEISYEFDPSLRPTQMDDMSAKIAEAQRVGQELAKDHGDELEKQALVMGAIKGFLTGGPGGAVMGAAREGITDAVTSGAKNLAGKAMRTPTLGGGGFNYGKVAFDFKSMGSSMGGLAQRAAGYAVRNPGTAATVAGAVGGAVMAPRDPQTGQKQYLRGAMMGGGLAAGANALSGGAIGNKMRGAVMNRESPLLGQKARSYMMEAAHATKGSYGKAAPTGSYASKVAPTRGAVPNAGAASGAASVPLAAGAKPSSSGSAGYNGGPVMGEVKLASLLIRAGLEKKANRQTLTYDPATKTFIRQHLTPSTGGEAVAGTGAAPIMPGHTEPVRSANVTHVGQAEYGSHAFLQERLRQAGIAQRSSPIASAGSSLGASAATGAQRAVRPMAGAAGGVAGIAGAAAKPKLPSLAGAVSLVKKAGFGDTAKKAVGVAASFGAHAGAGAAATAARPFLAASDMSPGGLGYAAGALAIPAGAYALGRHHGKKNNEK